MWATGIPLQNGVQFQQLQIDYSSLSQLDILIQFNQIQPRLIFSNRPTHKLL